EWDILWFESSNLQGLYFVPLINLLLVDRGQVNTANRFGFNDLMLLMGLSWIRSPLETGINVADWEMITSQLQGKLWLYNEVHTRTCLLGLKGFMKLLLLSARVEAGTTTTNLTEVVKNGNKMLKKTVENVEQVYEPTSAEEKLERKNEMKAKATLLMALPNKDQMKFHSYQDEKLLMAAIEKMYGGNKELKKLEIQGEVIEQEDKNLKLLRSLPSEWKTHALIWRNKVEIKTISLDDLYNNLKIYEPEITGSSSTSQNPQNVAFVSSNSTNNTNSTNKADNTVYGVSTVHSQGNTINSTSGDNLCDALICDFLSSQPNSHQLAQEALEQLHPNDLKEMDLQ
ncbi:hypothetical protein Tco_0489132, partial [Tanacetum coccineum]